MPDGAGRALPGAAAVAVGAASAWNISNVGTVAVPLAREYGVSLAWIGLLTTALFLTHTIAQLPAGRGADRFGARRVCLLALGLILVGNALALVAADPMLATVARVVVGLGSGAGFVAAADYMRSISGSALLQGVYGASNMAGGGLAIAVVPQLEPAFGWRAPYASAVLVALVASAIVVASRHDVRGGARSRFRRDRRLTRLAVIHAATFGLAVVAANWVVVLLERAGYERRAAAAIGSLVLLGGLITRPLGGLVLAWRPDSARGLIAAGAAGAVALFVLTLPVPWLVLAGAAAVAGLAAGLPFAALFTAAQRVQPDAPGAAIAYVNAWATFTIVVGTPLLGLSFSLPGDGRIGFALVSIAWGAAIFASNEAGDSG